MMNFSMGAGGDDDRTVKTGYAYGMIGALLLIVGFVAGIFVGDVQRSSASATTVPVQIKNAASVPNEFKDLDFRLFWNVWGELKDGYVEETPDDQALFYGAVRGLVNAVGDPYTVFFDPEEASMFATQLDGEFEGIGAEIGIKDDRLTIIAPLPDTPASRAGIKAGDWIVSIDDFDTFDITVEDAVTRIRGDRGSTVRLLIMRDGFDEPKEIPIIRDTIVIEAVTYEVESHNSKRYAVITVTTFNDKTNSQFSEAVRKSLLEGVDGVIVDLRNNPGGFLDSAVHVAGEWVPNDVIVTEKFSEEDQYPYRSSGQGRLAGTPTAVLVNRGSASASEIVAGALKDYGLATVIGETTFGKGSVQEYSEYDDGSALKMTVALWHTPKDHNIDQAGIEPDIEVEFTEEDFDAGRDPQKQKAYEVLEKSQ